MVAGALAKDALRSVRGSLRRFLSIAAICMLGTTMLIGLTIACEDLRLSADEFFNAQRLYDVSVQSTLGLTDDDVAALGRLEGVAAAEGSWSETAYTQVAGARHSVSVHAFSPDGLNEPYLEEGRLPATGDEVAVTREYLEESGASIGDTVEFGVRTGPSGEEEGEAAGTADADDTKDMASTDATTSTDLFATHPYTIVGVVIDPMSVAAKNGSSSFRATGARYTFFVTPDAATSSTYSVVYLSASGAAAENGFSDAYRDLVSRVTDEAEAIKDEREAARTQQIRDEASSKVDDAEAAAKSQLADAESQLDAAQAAIDDALAQIASGRDQLARKGAEATRQLDAAQAKIDAGRARLKAAKATLKANESQLASGEVQLADGQAKLDAAQRELDAQRAEAQAAVRDYDGGMAQVTDSAGQLAAALGSAWPASEWQAILDARDEQTSAAAQKAFTDKIDAYANQTGADLDAALRLADETLSLLDRLIAGDEDLRAEVSARADKLVASIEKTGLLTKDQLAQLHAARAELDDLMASPERLKDARAKLATVRANLAATRSQLAALPSQARQLAAAAGKLATNKSKVDTARTALATTIPQAQETIDSQQAKLEASRATLEHGREQLAQGWESYKRGVARLDAGQSQLDAQRALADQQLRDAAAQLDDAEAQAADGQAELDQNRAEYERQKADALARIAEARAKVDDIEDATWYVQDRSAISSYASIDSDASSIQVIGTVFPVIFLTVAILVSLTCATRMVEEERGLIGLYKALGYGRAPIMVKYVSYTVGAALLGGTMGSVLGFIALPKFLFTVFEVMYTLPVMTLHFDAGLCTLAVGMFVIGIGAATALAVRSELAEQPAALMRPRAPRVGTRILLEHIPLVWGRLSFLGKVCARNLFRYKKRLAMTVAGVAGCTALMISGFAIADTVLALAPNQYGGNGRTGVTTYDLLAVIQPPDIEEAASTFTKSPDVTDYIPVRTENVTIEHDGAKETVQLVVVPNGFSLDNYVNLHTKSDEQLTLDNTTTDPDRTPRSKDDGAIATINASVVLGFEAGDELTLQDATLRQATVTVEAVAMSYLGNVVYLTQDTYERIFGETLQPNALMAHLSGTEDEQIAFKDSLADDPIYLSLASTQEGVRDFTANFVLIDYVVVLITALAAGLSFVVLFTLSTTNISEREREMATIKVLGFRRGEVRAYVNKELIILAGLGTIAGIPLGTLMAHALTYVLNMPSMYFAVEVGPLSYVWSCGLSMVFAILTCLITNRSLDRIDMVGALKSAE